MMEKTRLNIAVTGLNNTDNPGPGVPVVRGIRESEVIDARIIGLAYENLEPGIYMEGMADKAYKIPYPSSGTDLFLERLQEIHARENIGLIIPNLDAELYSFIRLSKQLTTMGIRTFLPTVAQFEERQKGNLPSFGKKYGIQVPESIAALNESDIEAFGKDYEYPVVVKGKFYDAYLAYNLDQAIGHFSKLNAKWGLPVIIQQYIKGTEVNVVALGDGNGNTVAAVPMRKQYITDKGKAWGGITLSDARMLDISRDLIRDMKWRGGMELEMIRTRDDEYYMIEINPRIPAWVYLAVGAGQNIPDALVRLAMGMKVEPYKAYDVGKMFIRYSYDLICDLQQFQRFSMEGELG
jgi:carbamoyl-phosphate synthase large subunit